VIRREFVQTLSAGALATLALPRLPLMEEEKIRTIGIQLWTVREILDRDFEGTLAALGRIGIREVELYAGLYARKATEIRATLDRCGLSAPSGHVGLPEITETLDQTIENAHTIGQQYVVVASFPEEMHTVAGYTEAAAALNAAGEKLKAAGLTLGFHNHSDEFKPLHDASGDLANIGYDILLEQTDPARVVMELDLFWIRAGKRDPLTYFAKYPGRFHMVHVKDMGADGGMVDVGAGVIDWKAIFRQAHAAGVRHYFLEHDEPKDPLAFAKSGFDYLKQLRY
jgi:sugar phosphate isomerase/epimerase